MSNVIYLATERAKRQRYKNLSGPELWEATVSFLEVNKPPITNKAILKQGIDLFTEGHTKAITDDMRIICYDYIKLYKKELSKD